MKRLYDVVFLVRLQEEFEFDHTWEWLRTTRWTIQLNTISARQPSHPRGILCVVYSLRRFTWSSGETSPTSPPPRPPPPPRSCPVCDPITSTGCCSQLGVPVTLSLQRTPEVTVVFISSTRISRIVSATISDTDCRYVTTMPEIKQITGWRIVTKRSFIGSNKNNSGH